MLCKYLTPAVWNKYKDQSDSYGFTFKQAIFSGCKNADSSVGVYAGSLDSYTQFPDLFDKIIEDYHGVKFHPSEAGMSADKLEAPPLSEEDGKMIVSTRIRVGRNVKDFPLGPQLEK